MKRFLAAVFLCSVMALSACATTDEGASNYSKSNLTNRTSMKKYVNRPPDSTRIRKLDTISVTLQQAFIADLGNSIIEWGGNSVAVIVKCHELNDKNQLSFSSGVPGDGRVVFYSPDVEAPQFLNFSQMPIYGPITYNGGPLLFDIYVVRLKNNNGEISKGLMSVIANWGKMAYPEASPLLGQLNQIGTSILNSPDNNVFFHYTMTLYPDDGYRDITNGIVEVGDYFFIREKNREKKSDWDSLCLDEKSGRLYTGTGTGDNTCMEEKEKRKKETFTEKHLFIDSTYLSIQINKGYDSIALDLAQDTYTKFLNRLDDQANGQATNFGNVIDRTVQFADAKSIISANNMGHTINQAKLGRVLKTLGKSIETEKKILDGAGKPAVGEKPPVFSTDQIDYLLHEFTQLRGAEKVKEDGKVLNREMFLESSGGTIESNDKAKFGASGQTPAALTLTTFLSDVKKAEMQKPLPDKADEKGTQPSAEPKPGADVVSPKDSTPVEVK